MPGLWKEVRVEVARADTRCLVQVDGPGVVIQISMFHWMINVERNIYVSHGILRIEYDQPLPAIARHFPHTPDTNQPPHFPRSTARHPQAGKSRCLGPGYPYIIPALFGAFLSA